MTAKSILALCEQLRRVASFTVDDSGHVTDPDLLYHHIERNVLTLASQLDRARTRWESILADAEGLVIVDGKERLDLLAWLRRHTDPDSEGQR